MDAERGAQSLECRAGIRTAGVKHDHHRHTANRVAGDVGLGLHHVYQKITQIGAGLTVEVVARHNHVAIVVSPRVAPNPIIDDFDDIFWFVFVELFGLHHAQSAVFAHTRQVVQHAQRWVDLPDVIRVFGFEMYRRCGCKQLVGVQCVLAQSPCQCGLRQWCADPIGVDVLGSDQAVGA